MILYFLYMIKKVTWFTKTVSVWLRAHTCTYYGYIWSGTSEHYQQKISSGSFTNHPTLARFFPFHWFSLYLDYVYDTCHIFFNWLDNNIETYSLLRTSRDHPSLAVAVARTPPLLNWSLSRSWKSCDPLLFNLL